MTLSLSILQKRLINARLNPFALRVLPSKRGVHVIAERPPPSKIKFQPPPEEKGFFHYERSFCGDKRYSNPQIKETTVGEILSWKSLKHHKDLWPILFVTPFALAVGVLFGLTSLFKIEIWVDRTWRVGPFDWERCRNKYWKYWTTFADLDFKNGPTHKRLYEMEELQEQMLQKAKERGTRPITQQPDYFPQHGVIAKHAHQDPKLIK